MNFSTIWFIGAVFSHAHISRPAAEGSSGNSGNGIQKNDNINDPVASERYSNPCGYPARGNPVEKFTAGQSIAVEVSGEALHGGGHCQFGFSYDRKSFAITHTVTGTCPLERNYDVPIPKDAPNGVVTFIWGWNNKVGNREMYINCAEIEITGGQDSGSINGKELLLSNIQGAPNPKNFPEEGFNKELGDTMLNAQKPISVSPSGTQSNTKNPGYNGGNSQRSTQNDREQQYNPEDEDKKQYNGIDNNYPGPNQSNSQSGINSDNRNNIRNSMRDKTNAPNLGGNGNSFDYNDIDQNSIEQSPNQGSSPGNNQLNNLHPGNFNQGNSYNNEQFQNPNPYNQGMVNQNRSPSENYQSSVFRGQNGMGQVWGGRPSFM